MLPRTSRASWENRMCSSEGHPRKWKMFDEENGSPGKIASDRTDRSSSWKNSICLMRGLLENWYQFDEQKELPGKSWKGCSC